MESDGHLLFFDKDIYRRPNGSLGHKLYRKPTHTNFYLNFKSYHHPSSKARAQCGQDNLKMYLLLLVDVFRLNGYSEGRSVKYSTLFHVLVSLTDNRTRLSVLGLHPTALIGFGSGSVQELTTSWMLSVEGQPREEG
jgi:hypothetical protein